MNRPKELELFASEQEGNESVNVKRQAMWENVARGTRYPNDYGVTLREEPAPILFERYSLFQKFRNLMCWL